MRPFDSAPTPVRRSRAAKGRRPARTSCPAIARCIFASTELGGAACPPRPDHSQGYVWALYDSYDIFRANPDGSGVTRLTDTPGYDAEGTVCAKDGSIVFTSVRDGDIDLYRMDADGKNVKRLTHDVGYDGGAFFNADCSQDRVARVAAQAGHGARRLQALLAQKAGAPDQARALRRQRRRLRPGAGDVPRRGVVRAVFSPVAKRIIFSSNYGDPQGREFDIWGDRRRRHRPRAHHLRAAASTASRCSRPTASASRSRRTAPRRPASTTPTCSSPAGSNRPPRRPRAVRVSRAEPTSPRAADRVLDDVNGWPTPCAKGAASAPPGSQPRGVPREAFPRARALAGGRRRRIPASVPGDHRGEGQRRDRSPGGQARARA